MRDMANPNPDRRPNSPGRPLIRWRPWVQTGFLLVWLAPLAWINEQLGRIGRSVPSCVYHCYYAGGQVCPMASFSCPVGIVAQFCALGVAPFLAVGVVVLVAALAGSLVCGWACPFGFLQDLLSRVPLPKLRIPGWMSYGRYAVLALLVIALPYVFGATGTPYDEQSATICRWCPAGALEAGVPSSIQGWVQGKPELVLSGKKLAVLVAFLVAAVFTFRPWCTVLCPLGGFLSLFNRVSIFHLRFNRDKCTGCNLCRSRCSCGLKVEQAVNTSRCVRCLECTACGAIKPTLSAKRSSTIAGR